MKIWWNETAWPWLKQNWWVVLLAPILFLPWVAKAIFRMLTPPPEVIDPLKEADARAAQEQAARSAAAQEGIREREATLDALEAKQEAAEAAVKARQADEVEAMRAGDIDDLARRMRR
jgi:hypothetical protein